MKVTREMMRKMQHQYIRTGATLFNSQTRFQKHIYMYLPLFIYTL